MRHSRRPGRGHGSTTVGAQEVLTNQSVVKLHKAGLPAEVILAKIRSSRTSFDTSVDALVSLSVTPGYRESRGRA